LISGIPEARSSLLEPRIGVLFFFLGFLEKAAPYLLYNILIPSYIKGNTGKIYRKIMQEIVLG
jgi:hypothetical protein